MAAWVCILGQMKPDPETKPDPMRQTAQPAPQRLLRHLPLIVIVLIAVIGAITLRDYLSFDTLAANRQALLAYREAHYAALAAIFVATYVLIVAFSLPGAAVASMTGGFLFGLAVGTVLNVVAATIGAVAIFLAARAGLGAMLTARLEASEGTVKRLKEGLRRNEIEVLFLLRLVPAVPFFAANLIPALVGVKLRNYVLTTALGIVPGAIVFTWIGVGLGGVFDRGESPDLSLFREPFVIGPILGLCLLAALPIAIKALRGKPEGE
ncbi:membrane protein, putative [Ruegeria pomeroyi DSS-3]|uniref:TVP38/TMEM64 family membrane protein n=2 Tax=Ruegeria pomeroyi TaxID=89184 RepID=Q5LW04_RUEPO|nr:membrane protein, putative [Ruegeria pomeroyi DSS-3]